jgi:hypothetical protein
MIKYNYPLGRFFNNFKYFSTAGQPAYIDG